MFYQAIRNLTFLNIIINLVKQKLPIHLVVAIRFQIYKFLNLIYSEKIIGMCEYLLGRPVKYGYYKRSNTEQEICKLINDKNSVGDYDIIFCSNYLSVGVDINDKNCKFASI